MEKQELDALLAELSVQLRELGIPLGKHIAPQVEVNTRAQRVGEALGVEITRTVPLEGPAQPLRQEPVKYLLQCQSCGRLIPRRRLSKAVKYPSRYRCPCGGKLKLLNNTNMLC